METRSINNIVVVGGGTAGWMTALYARVIFPDTKITLVESEEIGVLGAGEGTIPHFIDLLDFLQIPFSALVKDAHATVKNGIKFTNWHNDNSFYYHAFGLYSDIGLGIEGGNLNPLSSSTLNSLVSAAALNKNAEDIEVVSDISEQKKVLLIKKENFEKKVSNPIYKYNSVGYWSIHFDASKLALVLRSYAESRNIQRVEGIVDLIEKDFNGEITNLILKNGINVDVDFVFDCTGFRKEIIGKFYKAEWKSHKDKLPVDTATPFFLPIDEDIPAYTESIAMKYGWMWKIPLQHRYGCGYVYDSSLLSEEDAAKEIEEYLGFVPEYPRANKGSFKFEAGYYKTPWINNCIAVGLSSGFIEPLEATSLWVTIMQLKMALSNPERMYIKDQRIYDHFNRKHREINDQVVDFIYFHYMTNRDDTEFWSKFTYKNAPDFIKQLLDSWEYRLPEFDDYKKNTWSLHSWFEVGLGVGKINNKIAVLSELNSPPQKFSSSVYTEIKAKNITLTSSCVSHKEFLKDLSNE